MVRRGGDMPRAELRLRLLSKVERSADREEKEKKKRK